LAIAKPAIAAWPKRPTDFELHLLAAFSNLLIGEKYLLADGQCTRISPKWRETSKK